MFTPSEGTNAAVAEVSAATSRPMQVAVEIQPLPTSAKRRRSFTGKTKAFRCLHLVHVNSFRVGID